MMQELELELNKQSKPVIRIDFSVMAVSHLMAHHAIFGCVDFQHRQVFGIPYQICPDQEVYFQIIVGV